MTSAKIILAVLWIAVTLYAVFAGADFGGGVLDLFARGPRAGRQREAISKAMGPVWEANHVWLIFFITGLFSAFPRAFSVLSVALYLPATLALAGIVLRGAAFAFRSHASFTPTGCSRSGSGCSSSPAPRSRSPSPPSSPPPICAWRGSVPASPRSPMTSDAVQSKPRWPPAPYRSLR